jgi:hypothetical protein
VAGHVLRGMTVKDWGAGQTVAQRKGAAGRPMFYNSGNLELYAQNAAQLGGMGGTPAHLHPLGDSGSIAPLFQSQDQHTYFERSEIPCACRGSRASDVVN